MSNLVCVDSITFVNNKTKEKTFGACIYDGYGKGYVNDLESVVDNDLELLKILVDSDDEVIQGIIGHVRESEKGMMLCDTWYDWDEIKNVLDKESVQ